MQLFPRSLNFLPLALALGSRRSRRRRDLGAIWYYFSPKNLQVGYAPEQPVHYSHKLHADELGIDCRYCHANVERSQEAMVPPTETCMGCHAVVKKDSPALARAARQLVDRQAGAVDPRAQAARPRVLRSQRAPAAGVGCSSCHGRIDQMEVVRLDKPLAMGWCLECHRDPAPNLRPKDQITNMSWQTSDGGEQLAQRRRPSAAALFRVSPMSSEIEHERPTPAARSSGGAWKRKTTRRGCSEEAHGSDVVKQTIGVTELSRLKRRHVPDLERRDLGARRDRGLHSPSGREDPSVHECRPRTFRRACLCTTRACTNAAARRIGLLVQAYEGRPTKIEGNPDHPASLGATDLLTQASILRPLRHRSRAHAVARGHRQDLRRLRRGAQGPRGASYGKNGGAGLRILREPTNRRASCACARRSSSGCPRRASTRYAPINDSNARAGAKLAFGQPLVVSRSSRTPR